MNQKTHADHEMSEGMYPTPQAAIEQSEPETLAYVMGLYVGTDIDAPDFLAVVDLDPESDTYSEIVNTLPMPNRGDELHHFGWNACSSSCHVEGMQRRHLLVPGQRSSRIHVVDTVDRRNPEIVKVIEPDEVFEQDLSAPHTVHCAPGGKILLSMLGDSEGELPGGFLQLNQDFEIEGHWENHTDGFEMNYDFWYQPRQNVMLSSEWAAPKTYQPGFDLEDVEAGKYGRQIHVWEWESRDHIQTIDLGEEGMIPLEVRFLHSPESTSAYVGAALSSNIQRIYRQNGTWEAETVIETEARDHPDWDIPVPSLITDLLISMDDRYLFFSNWFHGEVHMYDISDPAHPRLADTLSVGGLFGERHEVQGREVIAGPQMLQLSLDGERLYWTTSLYSSWDNQFYPEEGEKGSVMLKADVNPRKGTMTLDEDFLVDFANAPQGPARAHEIRWPDGDCTSDVWQ